MEGRQGEREGGRKSDVFTTGQISLMGRQERPLFNNPPDRQTVTS